jgi:hypothetical protein
MQGRYGEGPSPGHHRVQEFERTGSGDITAYSPWSDANAQLGVAAGSAKYFYVLVARITNDVTATNKIVMSHVRRLESGAEEAATAVLTVTGGTPALSWAVYTAEASPAMTAQSMYHQILLTMTDAAGAPTFQIAFCGLGVWDGVLDGYTTWERLPSFNGTFGEKARMGGGLDRDFYGGVRTVGRKRFRQPHRLTFNVTGAEQTMRDDLAKAHEVNGGVEGDGSSIEYDAPSGGRKPVLIVPGNPAMPLACYADFEDEASPLHPILWAVDPPLYGGTFSMLERV